MGIDAVALLHLSSSTLAETLAPVPGNPQALRADNGETLSLVELDDATLVRGFAPFGAEPEELGARLTTLLGRGLAQHEDDRGIYVFPDVAKPQSRTYGGLIEEVGEVGFWVDLPTAASSQTSSNGALPANLQAQLGDLIGGVDPDALAELQRAVAGGDAAQLERLSAQLQGALGADAELPQPLDHSLQEALDQARGLLGTPGADPAATDDRPSTGAAMPLGGDLTALADAARQQLQALSDEERDQVAAMARQFGLPIGDPSDLMAALGGLGAALAPPPTSSETPTEEADESGAPGPHPPNHASDGNDANDKDDER
jgi:hypothetical protein